MAKRPIPRPPSTIPQNIRNILMAIKEHIESISGGRRDKITVLDDIIEPDLDETTPATNAEIAVRVNELTENVNDLQSKLNDLINRIQE